MKYKHLLVVGRAFEGENFGYDCKNLTASQAVEEFNKEIEDCYGEGRESIVEMVLASNSKIEILGGDLF